MQNSTGQISRLVPLGELGRDLGWALNIRPEKTSNNTFRDSPQGYPDMQETLGKGRFCDSLFGFNTPRQLSVNGSGAVQGQGELVLR